MFIQLNRTTVGTVVYIIMSYMYLNTQVNSTVQYAAWVQHSKHNITFIFPSQPSLYWLFRAPGKFLRHSYWYNQIPYSIRNLFSTVYRSLVLYIGIEYCVKDKRCIKETPKVWPKSYILTIWRWHIIIFYFKG